MSKELIYAAGAVIAVVLIMRAYAEAQLASGYARVSDNIASIN